MVDKLGNDVGFNECRLDSVILKFRLSLRMGDSYE